MKTLVCLLALIVAPALAADEAETKKNPREALDTAIPHGIELLEAKDYRKFLESFLPPDDLKRLAAQTSLERFLEDFAARKAERLLLVLRDIKGRQPELSEDEMVAEFPLSEELQEKLAALGQGKKSIRFKKIGQFWYIEN